MRDYTMIDDFRVWESDYDNQKGKYELDNLQSYSILAAYTMWCNENYINGTDDCTLKEVYDNTSALRDGLRIDLMDNDDLTPDGRYQISYLWALENGIVYAAVWDTQQSEYVGDIEILN
jgi:hypothetical protein